MPCVVCDGRGCASCGQRGSHEIVGCPYKLLDSGTHSALLAASLAEKGMWPVSGGWMDQTQSCLDAVLYIWAEQARYKADMAKSDGR